MTQKIVVIGAGVGGLAAAALLAKAGNDVTLLEAHSFAGGRCASIEREGFVFDFGVHMFSRGDRGPHGEVNRQLGGNLKWMTHDPACRVMGRVEFDFPININPLMTQVRLARKLGVSPGNYLGAFRLFQALRKERAVDFHDHMTVQEYVSRYTDDEMIHLFMNCISQLYFAISYQKASAGEFIWSFSRMFRESAFGYPAGGGGKIPAAFLDGLIKYGGKIRFDEPVVQIHVDSDRVTGVETAGGHYPADIVLSNCGMSATITLAGQAHFPADYVKKAEQLSYSNAYVTIKYALAYPVVPYPVVFYMPHLPPAEVFSYIDNNSVPEDPYIFMPVPSNQDPSLAPADKQLIIAGTAAPSGASTALCDAILDKVHAKVCELFPGLEAAVIWQSRSTRKDVTELTMHPAGEAIGLAQIPGQVGLLRPNVATPVEGLWLVGADAGARGIGTEMASGSALHLVNIIEKI